MISLRPLDILENSSDRISLRVHQCQRVPLLFHDSLNNQPVMYVGSFELDNAADEELNV